MNTNEKMIVSIFEACGIKVLQIMFDCNVQMFLVKPDLANLAEGVIPKLFDQLKIYHFNATLDESTGNITLIQSFD